MWRLCVFPKEALLFKNKIKHKYLRESRDVLGGRNEVCDRYMRKADCDKKS